MTHFGRTHEFQRCLSPFRICLAKIGLLILETPTIMNSSDEMRGLVREVKAQILILAVCIGVMWGVEIVDLGLGGALKQFGIMPRSIVGLRGILFAPILHGNIPHLVANTIPFATLGWFVMLRRTSDFFGVTAIAMLVGGLGTWLFAPANTVHIGASGVIFGYLGFLISRGYFERRIGSVIVSLLIGIFYGGLIWGVLPGQIGISWQGHLFGFVGGIVAAWLMTDTKPQNAKPQKVRSPRY